MLTQYAVGHILYLRTGNGGEQNPRVEVATEPGTGSKPLLSSEGREARQTVSDAKQVRTPRPNSTRRLEQSRSQPYRSLTIERDEAPDPDVKHIAGEATGTRAERDTAMVEVLAVKR